MSFPFRSSASLIVLALMSAASPAAAQQANDHSGPNDYHAGEDETIVVTGAVAVSRKHVLSGVAVLSGTELDQALRPSLGETLADTPGVSASSFGPNASRPVLRGLQGERVRVLSNGIGAIDASNTSADHALAINPLLAKRIEVLRGPQSLQYGSAAIGGVVNVIDRRIPTEIPDEPVHIGALVGYGSAASERMASGSVDLSLGSGWVAHFDGSWLKADNVRIPGYALTPALRTEALASSLIEEDEEAHEGEHEGEGHEHGEVDFAANAAVRGRLANSAARTWNLAAGLAYVGEGGSIGLAYSKLDNRYGVPIRYATQPGQGQEAPLLQIRQDRIDARAELKLGGDLLDKLVFRYGFADYSHFEIEEDGTVATSFFNQGMEGRLELVQTARGGWTGASGMQFVLRDFDVVGDEAYLPRNETRQFGLFTLQQLETGSWKLEAGLRYESSRLASLPGPDQPQFFAGERSFDTFSASVGAAYDLAPGWKAGINLSQSERSPAAEELFAFGPHHGTETFEIGNPVLRKERARSIEAILRGSGDGFDLELSAYHSWFANFIYEARTGGFSDGLPEYQITQADARIYGFEAQADVVLARAGVWTLKAQAMADYVHATIDGAGPAPRIPPLRLKGALAANSSDLDFEAEVERVTGQNRTAAFETATPGYTMVNASVAWRPWGKQRPLSLMLSVNNLFDVEARRHASLLKDYAPLPGRDIRLTARIEL